MGDVWVDLAIAAIDVVVGNEEVSAMSWTAQKNEVKVVFLDGSVHVGEDEVLSWNSAPVADDFLFDVSLGKWAFK